MTGFDERMAGLRAHFRLRIANERARLQTAVDAGDWTEARRLSHGLSGSAGMFGFSAISTAAQALEEAIDAGADGPELRRAATGLLSSLDDTV